MYQDILRIYYILSFIENIRITIIENMPIKRTHDKNEVLNFKIVCRKLLKYLKLVKLSNFFEFFDVSVKA